jgi:hypothetical protein
MRIGGREAVSKDVVGDTWTLVLRATLPRNSLVDAPATFNSPALLSSSLSHFSKSIATGGMSENKGAYGTKNVEFRRKWDKEEYAEKAKKKDDEERERMKENEERMKQGALFKTF